MDRIMTYTPEPTVTKRTHPAATPAEPKEPAEPEPIVRLEDVSVTYQLRSGMMSRRSAEVTAVDRVSLSIARGQTLGLVGGTGSGKSTVAHMVMGMVTPDSGSVVVAGKDLGRLKGHDKLTVQRMVQVVMQDPYSSLDPRMKVGDIIAEPLTLGRLHRGAARRGIDERIRELLGLVGLRANRAERYPHQFSGGQRQRIAIARALAPKPELIVLDEPTSALDVSVRAQILTLLKGLQTELGVTYLVISHDLVTVAYLASEVAVMHLGRIVEIGPTRKLYTNPRHPYTLELLASAPGAGGEFLSQPRPSATPESLPPTACKFAYRCALRTRLGNPSRCVEKDPELIQITPGHRSACHFSAEVAEIASDTGAGPITTR
jgi:oligopeptide/dipeptide ABC transporter ATP-binding protein